MTNTINGIFKLENSQEYSKWISGYQNSSMPNLLTTHLMVEKLKLKVFARIVRDYSNQHKRIVICLNCPQAINHLLSLINDLNVEIFSNKTIPVSKIILASISSLKHISLSNDDLVLISPYFNLLKDVKSFPNCKAIIVYCSIEEHDILDAMMSKCNILAKTSTFDKIVED
jgi:hypothetical protein